MSKLNPNSGKTNNMIKTNLLKARHINVHTLRHLKLFKQSLVKDYLIRLCLVKKCMYLNYFECYFITFKFKLQICILFATLIQIQELNHNLKGFSIQFWMTHNPLYMQKYFHFHLCTWCFCPNQLPLHSKNSLHQCAIMLLWTSSPSTSIRQGQKTRKLQKMTCPLTLSAARFTKHTLLRPAVLYHEECRTHHIQELLWWILQVHVGSSQQNNELVVSGDHVTDESRAVLAFKKLMKYHLIIMNEQFQNYLMTLKVLNMGKSCVLL